MNNRFLLYLLSFILLLSCSRNKKSENTSSAAQDTILYDSHTSPSKYGFPLKKYTYIPLETTDESLIGEITKILYKNDKFYILDKNVSGNIYVFNKLGKFIYKVDSKGKGYGEYISPADFDIDDDGHIYVYDFQSRKVIVYNEGKSIQEIKMDVRFMEFALSKDKGKLFLFKTLDQEGFDFLVNSYDISGHKLLERSLPADRVLDDFTIRFNAAFTLFHSEASLLFQKRFTPLVYSYDLMNNNLNKRLYIKSDLFPKKDFIEKIPRDPSLFDHGNAQLFIQDITDIYETKAFLVFNIYLNRGNAIKALLNKKTKKVSYSSQLVNDVLTDNLIDGICEDSFISVYSGFVDENKFSEELKTLKAGESEKAKLRKLKPGDNPVLVLLDYNENL